MEASARCKWYTQVVTRTKGREKPVASRSLSTSRHWKKSYAKFTIPGSKVRDYSLRCKRTCLQKNKELYPIKWIYHRKARLLSRLDIAYKTESLPRGVIVKDESGAESNLEFISLSSKLTGLYYCESIDLIKSPPLFITIADDNGCKWFKKWEKRCHVNAHCVDKRYGFACRCRPGFRGDGKKQCEGNCQ